MDYKRYVRGKTLGVDYTREAINARIDLNRMGFKTINFQSGNKHFKAKNLKGNKFYFKNKSLLEINIELGIKIIMLLFNSYKPEKSTRSKYIRKYNEAVIEKLSDQLKQVDEYKITGLDTLEHEINENDKKLVKARIALKESDAKMKF